MPSRVVDEPEVRNEKRALQRRFPDVGARIPHVALCRLPTPVAHASALERSAGTGPLWLKHDERTASPYGGNKARKLEWILGRALARGRSRVLTFGALGTNHGFATALYAGRAGLGCDLVLVDQPVDERVRRRMRQFAAVGADLHYGGTLTGAALRTLVALTRHPGTQLIPMGGSSPLGVLGFIDAGLELADQIEQGALPEPERLYVALGTGGTAAGLAVGLALAGLRTRVVGVLVTDRGTLQPNRRLVEWLARRAARLLARAGAEPGRLELRLEIETGFRGAGYGHPTPACVEAVERAAQEEGLRLETTYTGKALAALIARESGGVDPVLFWNTYAGVDPELELPDWSALPRPFHRFFEAST